MKITTVLIILYYVMFMIHAAVHRTTIKKTGSIRQQLLRYLYLYIFFFFEINC